LDGQERQFTAAQLLVNEIPVEIPVDSLAEFEVELTNLRMGDNAIQIAALDEQGLRVTSPLVLLTIQEGRQSLPEELNPRAGIGRIIGMIVLLLVAFGGLGGFGYFAWRQGWLRQIQIPSLIPRGPRRRELVELPDTVSDLTPDLPPDAYAQPQSGPARAFLEVLDSVSPMPQEIPVRGTQVRIGRSPQQSDVVFEKDVTVSRLHASLMLEGNHYRIFDERSTSGAWVNDQQVPEYGIQLIDGDEIYLGAVHLRFRQP
ncbi:MAG: FHA domain-containing protein, partial [Anaerolineae bacterium]